MKKLKYCQSKIEGPWSNSTLSSSTLSCLQIQFFKNKVEGTLSEEHNVQEEDTAHPFFDDIIDKDAAVTPDLERKSDETEEVNIEEKEASNETKEVNIEEKEASNVKSGETEELDLET
ncbi:hypothetical protein Tco_0239464, partial [Tanacetum coccineum]